MSCPPVTHAPVNARDDGGLSVTASFEIRGAEGAAAAKTADPASVGATGRLRGGGSLTEAIAARWMLEQIEAEGFLGHQRALAEIGEDFIYLNAHGHRAISPAVLAAFRDASGDRVVWSRRGRFWRLRRSSDRPGRRSQP